MRCKDVIDRLERELPFEVNKSHIHYYDRTGLVSPDRAFDIFHSREYEENDYRKLRTALMLAYIGIGLKQVRLFFMGARKSTAKEVDKRRLICSILHEEVENEKNF